jgi:hypothetical protein
MTRRAAPGGVAYSADCYRTVNGIRYTAWMFYISEDRIAAYRKAGIRCRRFAGELFIHPDDEAAAEQIDREAEKGGAA